MFATRWQPFNDVWSEMGRLYDEMNRAFDRMGYRDRIGRFAPTFPAVDLWQDEDNFHVEAELPGEGKKGTSLILANDRHESVMSPFMSPFRESHGAWV
jgi:HSP20 family molecular chaperone IbpA